MSTNAQFDELTHKLKEVLEKYKQNFPEVNMDRDYLPFKITEEWGECLQAYLMMTGRGRQKDKSAEEIKKMFADECADVLGYLLLLAHQENINLTKALEEKWFQYLK